MGVTIGGDAAKSYMNTNLLVVILMRLSQNIGMLDLTNLTLSKKGNGWKICMKSVCNYWGIRLMLNTWFIYYRHTKVNLLGVRESVSENVLACAPQTQLFY